MGHQHNRAALSARPDDALVAAPAVAGMHSLEVEEQRDSVLCVPSSPQAGQPAPLLVALHGAGGLPEGTLSVLQAVADQYAVVVLAPVSRGSTWDGIRNGYGPDVEVIDRSLRRAFEVVLIDQERIGIAGFSDGASYALGLGLANGDLFSHVIAFSPGFVPSAARVGRPRIFISHGVTDRILPIDRTSRHIVPTLQQDGYDVTYLEFDGAHTVPLDIALQAAEWLGWSNLPPG
ncbi:alpha/beta hydrolase [Kocuria arenosa]|uniref:alpha/beta hydrolase n=1 Tax=Kocuria arenosa TaxID=3071446 RepID=UPI0034D6FF0F